jgi:hypothetical protein
LLARLAKFVVPGTPIDARRTLIVSTLALLDGEVAAAREGASRGAALAVTYRGDEDHAYGRMLSAQAAWRAGVAPDRTLALIHYEDATDAAWCALHHPAPQPTYLAVTPPCPTRREFYMAACVVLGLDLPSFGPALGLPPAEYNTARLRADLLPSAGHPRWQAALVP